jgi:hypothetical protein
VKLAKSPTSRARGKNAGSSEVPSSYVVMASYVLGRPCCGSEEFVIGHVAGLRVVSWELRLDWTQKSGR